MALTLFGLVICIANHPFSDNADGGYLNLPLLVTGALVFITGSLFTAASLKNRRHIIRLLRDGRLTNASIEEIKPGKNQGVQNENQRMTIMYAANGLQFQSSCKINSDTAFRANKLIEKQSPARILYDPDHPSRFLYVDAMLNVSPEVEV